MKTRKNAVPERGDLRAMNRARVLVVGDAMLDRYWYGEVDRISPEAPVPIVRIDQKKKDERPGGAANVAFNAAELGAQVTLLSVVGVDEPGARLEKLLKHKGVRALLHHDRSIMTTVKLRVVGRHQQLVRVDFETSPSHEVLASKLADFEKKLPACDVVILSDYGKGGLKHIARMIALANRAGKVVLVDPKGDDYQQYRNATMLTPNRAEFQQVMGDWKSDKEFAAKARQLMRKLNLKALLVTRGEEGMTLFSDEKMVHVPAQAREVFDVSGAGDTVIAVLGVMLASGAKLPDAVRVANRAAGIVVGKLGTAVVHREELFAS
ncbi:MAG TPA: D-glycero-beta-D-manno-heptose-7-phosphate kinase [Burkholderiales bacterium]|nr:D-glycero-beta-D-manno-heptose-7-phosphate kinase [Burkholderiales bacterium]